MASLIGQTVSHYKILEHLGGGGMGVVYKAQDLTLPRTVALKFLPPTLTLDPEAQKRFVHEARAASVLDHPNICTLHEVGHTDDGQMFIVMACYDGQTLKMKIEKGPLEIDFALEIAIQVSEGLSRAHEAEIVHRDIKPANIFITNRGELKILDFGLAKLAGQSMLTGSSTTLGTAAYMSPEQANGETVDQRTDIWSLGVVLYEMLTAKRPFESDYEQALVYAILNEEPKSLRTLRPDVPEVVEQIVLKALAKSPEDRYQKADDVLADLKAARAPEQTGVTIAATEALRRKSKRLQKRSLLAAGLVTVILAVGLLVVLPLIQDQALASHPRGITFISLENRTGDPSLDNLRDVVPDILGATLEDSKYIRVTRFDRMRELMKQIGRDTVEFIDRQTGLLLCRRAGIDVMGVGSYAKAGSMFLAQLELIDVNTGVRLGSPMKARGQDVESFLKDDGIVEELARQVPRMMGVSQISTQSSVKPVTEVGSSSIEAQMYYQRGMREVWSNSEGKPYFKLAVKQDSTFAIAWYYLGNTAMAVKYASRATERERFRIADGDLDFRASLLKEKGREETGRNRSLWLKARCEIFPFDAEFRFWYGFYLGDHGKAAEAIAELEKTLQLDPAFAQAYNSLGYCYVSTGEGEKAIQVLKRYIELFPGYRDPLNSMAECLLMLGRYDEAIAKGREAVEVAPDSPYDRWELARLYFMKEDYDSALVWSSWPVNTAPPASGWAAHLYWHAYYLLWCGRLSEAEATLRESERMVLNAYLSKQATAADRNNTLGNISYVRAWCAYEKGDCKNARLQLSNCVALMTLGQSFSQLCFGLIDLREGKLDSIEGRRVRIQDWLLAFSRRDNANHEWSEESERWSGNALEAGYLLATGRPAEIRPNWTPHRNIQIPDSMATASWPLFVPFAGVPGAAAALAWIPVPFDILPRAYVARGMIDSAIASYELALKKPPHWLGPIIPRYYYRVARLYEEKGIKEKAIESYKQFLKVWGKADPVYEEPADARARLARLKRG